jgi:hypothetical protein
MAKLFRTCMGKRYSKKDLSNGEFSYSYCNLTGKITLLLRAVTDKEKVNHWLVMEKDEWERVSSFVAKCKHEDGKGID